jgi:hypothetical protein
MESTSSTLSASPVSELLAARILEDVDLAGELMALVPKGREEWRPEGWPGEPFTLAALRDHMAEALGGVCACLYRLHPEQLKHFELLRGSVNYAELRQAAAEGFQFVRDADLLLLLPTVFSPEGKPFLETLMVNWKHLLHHSHQLFTYLKLLGIPVETRHLYRFH